PYCQYIHLLFHVHPTTSIYTLSLHDALPISREFQTVPSSPRGCVTMRWLQYRIAACDRALRKSNVVTGPRGPLLECVVAAEELRDRKSTRLNSSHQIISYAVFCLKKTRFMNQ